MSFSVDIHPILICHLVLIRGGYTPHFDMSFSVDKGRLYTSFWYVIYKLIRSFSVEVYTPHFDMSFSVDKGRLYTSFWYVI